jgi:antitoxin HigA-1
MKEGATMTPHPGAVLAEEFMAPLGLNASRLAAGLGVHRSTVGRLLAGEQRVTPEFAARLGAFFGTPARWWLLLQVEYDADVVTPAAEVLDEVTRLELPSDVLLTPKGVVRLGPSEDPNPGPRQPVSLVVGGEHEVRGEPADERRRVRQVRYENGAVALVGDS